ncbi:MAG TPA: efflux RND transporter permease subunit [Streptosporangiaceae bacterium]|jgi:HAE1 family hydrophobic/amphiphilic exporter-1
MSRLARLSLANRGLVALTTIILIVFGLFATTSLKQELIPSLQLPVAVVTAPYPGASPDVVEKEVTEPVENAVKGTDGEKTTTSTSRAGMSTVQVEFDYGTDTKAAVQDMQQSIGRITGLPDNVDPTVQAGSTDDLPVVMLAVSGGTDQHALADKLDKTVVPDLAGINGVNDVQVTGVRDQRVQINLHDKWMKVAGLTPSAVSSALQANGIVMPGGDLTSGGKTLAIDAGRSFTSLDDLKNLYIAPSAAGAGGGQTAQPGQTGQSGQAGAGQSGAAGAAGAAGQPGAAAGRSGAAAAPGAAAAAQAPKPKPVRLEQIADVKLVDAPATSLTRTDGKPTLGVSVTKTHDGNVVSISDAVRNKMDSLRSKLGDNADLTVTFDQAPFIKDSITGLTEEGLLGLGFAIVVILLFLFSFRSTIVTAVSIPLSLLIALIAMYAGGYSLNILTLGALTIAVGRVVDDSIVVLENIKRHLGYGEARRHAVLTAVKEVSGAVTASTITTIAVFLPIAFVGGQVGELFRPFAVAIAVALLASLLVALTIIPTLAYWFLRPPRAVRESPEKAEAIRAAAELKERRGLLQRVYVPVIRWATGHKIITLALGVLVFFGTIALVPGIKTDFIGSSGQNTLSVTQKLPPGTSLARTNTEAKRVENVIRGFNQVETVQTTVGSGGGFAAFTGGGDTNQASFSITTDVNADQQKFSDDLKAKLDGLKGAGEVTVGDSSGGGFGSSQLEVVVTAPDTNVLKTATNQVTNAVRGVSGATEVASDLAADQPGVSVTTKRKDAAVNGLSDASISQAVQQAMALSTAKITVNGTEHDLIVRDGASPGTLAKLRDLKLPTATGQTVKLTDVATVKRVERPTQLTRIDGNRSAKVTATPSGNLTKINAQLTQKVNALHLPSGATAKIGGVSSDQQDSFSQLGLALLAAIAIVFLVMVATFRSLIQPLILLVSIPFAATGALLLLRGTGTPLGVAAIIGMLMLVGIVVTNAIVLIDLINQYRAQGMGVREAVVEGGRHRLRPILMTAIATVCALFPMSIGLTGGGVFISQPLAVVVIGGLISSTLLTLLIVPTLYTLVEEFKDRMRTRRHGDEGGGTPHPTPTPTPEPEPARS